MELESSVTTVTASAGPCQGIRGGIFRGLLTFQGCHGLTLRALLLDTLEHRRQQVSYAALDMVSGVARHENVRICIQALGAALGTAALEVGDLLHALVEFGPPSRFGNVGLFAVE
jgi:hypothetical protein